MNPLGATAVLPVVEQVCKGGRQLPQLVSHFLGMSPETLEGMYRPWSELRNIEANQRAIELDVATGQPVRIREEDIKRAASVTLEARSCYLVAQYLPVISGPVTSVGDAVGRPVMRVWHFAVIADAFIDLWDCMTELGHYISLVNEFKKGRIHPEASEGAYAHWEVPKEKFGQLEPAVEKEAFSVDPVPMLLMLSLLGAVGSLMIKKRPQRVAVLGVCGGVGTLSLALLPFRRDGDFSDRAVSSSTLGWQRYEGVCPPAVRREIHHEVATLKVAGQLVSQGAWWVRELAMRAYHFWLMFDTTDPRTQTAIDTRWIWACRRITKRTALWDRLVSYLARPFFRVVGMDGEQTDYDPRHLFGVVSQLMGTNRGGEYAPNQVHSVSARETRAAEQARRKRIANAQ